MGFDFDLEEGNIRGVKEEGKKSSGPSPRILIAAVAIIVVAAFFLWFVSTKSVLMSSLTAGNGIFSPISTLDVSKSLDSESESPQADHNPTQNQVSETPKSQQIPDFQLSIVFNSKLVSSDYSFDVKNTNLEIDAQVLGTTESESFSYSGGNYNLSNFSGKIYSNKGFVELEGTSDQFDTPIGARKINGKIFISIQSGVIALRDAYLDSFNQTVTGNVSTSTASVTASGPFSLTGFKGNITLGLNNSVSFEGKTSKLNVTTTSGKVDMS